MIPKIKIDWVNTPRLLDRFKQLLFNGFGYQEMANILSSEFKLPINYKGIDNARQRYCPAHLISEGSNIKIYKSETIPDDNYIISCDYHAPFFSIPWANKLLAIAEKFKIKKHIIAGDLFDMSFAKLHKFMDGERKDEMDIEKKESDPLMHAFNYFDEIILISGNHETRIGRMTDAKIQFRHLIYAFGEELGGKLKFSEYDKLFIGKKWLVVHPRSYSQISGSVAVRLAEKYSRHVLNAHGHFISLRYERSGQYMGIDLGGMFNRDKIAYVNLTTTTHPMWNNGFGIILNNNFLHFHKDSYWEKLI